MKTYRQTKYGEYSEGDVAVTLRSSFGDYGGGSETLVVSYQNTVGTLSPGGHPGSYNGQDAWNDMLVTDDGTIMHGNRTSERRNNAGGGVSNIELYK